MICKDCKKDVGPERVRFGLPMKFVCKNCNKEWESQ